MSGFDPDEYMHEEGLNDFSPDEYLAKEKPMSIGESFAHGIPKGVTFGFFDEGQGAFEAVGRAAGLKGLGGPIRDWSLQEPTGFDLEKFKESYREGRDAQRAVDRHAKLSNPVANTLGELAGGLATAKLPLGAAKTLGQAASTGAKLGAVGGLGNSEAEDMGGMLVDSALGAGTGAVLGSGFYGVGKGIEKAAPKVKQNLATIGEALKLKKKANAAEIQAAAKRLGAKATPGMIYDDVTLQGLESSLSQSPSIPGMLVRKSTVPVEKAVDDVAAGALSDASSLSPFALGERVKSGIESNVEGRLAPSRAVFQELAESSPHITPNPKSLERVAKNIANIDEVRLGFAGGASWANKALQYGEMLKKAKSVKDITTIRQLIGADLEAAKQTRGPERLVFGSLYDRATRLEENSMMRGAVDTMRSFAQKPTGKTGDALAAEGEQIGLDMINKMRWAKKDFHNQAQTLRDVAGAARIKRAGSPQEFLSAVDNIRSENVADKLFNVDDVALMRKMQDVFPDQAKLMRQGQLGEIQRASSLSSGELSTPKFFQQVKGIPNAESQQILFGENLPKIADAKTVMQSLPEYIGPSGTPKGMEYLNMLDPFKAAHDFGRYALYKGRTSESTQKVADYLMQLPKMRQLAQTNPQAFRAAVISLSERVRPGGGVSVPKAAERNELDRDSSTPAQQPRVSPEDARKQFMEGM